MLSNSLRWFGYVVYDATAIYDVLMEQFSWFLLRRQIKEIEITLTWLRWGNLMRETKLLLKAAKKKTKKKKNQQQQTNKKKQQQTNKQKKQRYD